MGHSIRVRVGSSSGWVIFGLNEISGRFGLGRVWFGSGRFRLNQFLVKYACHAKTSNFVENFGSGMVRFGSIRVSSALSGEHISSVGSGMGPGRSVRVSSLGSVLPGLPMTHHLSHETFQPINIKKRGTPENITRIILLR